MARVAVEKPSEERSSPHALCCTQDPWLGSCRQTEEFDDAKPSTNCVRPSLPAKPGNGLTSWVWFFDHGKMPPTGCCGTVQLRSHLSCGSAGRATIVV